jgi:hypothetical protein
MILSSFVATLSSSVNVFTFRKPEQGRSVDRTHESSKKDRARICGSIHHLIHLGLPSMVCPFSTE